jgi:hypothetical protein
MSLNHPEPGSAFDPRSPLLAAAAAILFCVSAGLMTGLAYAWSFTTTMFGGYLGATLPVILCCFCALAGYAMRDSLGRP